MENWKFTSLINLSADDQKHLKLAFNTNWRYHPEDWGSPIFGEAEFDFDLYDMYAKQGEAERVRESVKTHCARGRKRRYMNGDLVFSFIPYTSEKDWVLISAFRVIDDSKQLIVADEEYLAKYRPLFGRLIVHFDGKGRSVILKKPEIIDTIYVKAILEQPCDREEAIFPGYDQVCVVYGELKNYLENSIAWQEKLKERRGIYAIGDRKTGRLYVGSAMGEEGIYSRWRTYVEEGYDRHEQEDGKYPNLKLQEIVKTQGMEYIKENFQYSILETFTENIEKDYIRQREKWWKDTLLSRQTYGGYNAN